MTTEVFTAKEVAERLKISRPTVDKLIKAGKLRAIDVATGKNHKYRIPDYELERFISEQLGEPPEPPKPKRMTRKNRRPKVKQYV